MLDLTRTQLHIAALDGIVERHDGYAVVRTPSNPGFHFGNYVALDAPPTSLGECEARFAAHFGDEVAHVAFGWDTDPGSDGFQDDARRAGYELESSVAMVMRTPPDPAEGEWSIAPIPTARWDDLVRLDRCADGSEEAGGDSYRAFRDRQRAGWRQWIDAGRATWWGVSVEDELVAQCGFVVCPGEAAADEPLGRFQSVETHPAWRRRGICSALVRTVARDAFERLSCRAVLLEADEAGPALGPYRRIGFEMEGSTHRASRSGSALRVRDELPRDRAGVHSLVTAAFGQADEAGLIDDLRGQEGVLSLVAELSGKLMGHALFSPVAVDGAPELRAVALGPVAVRPSHQRRGVGSALIREGLARCRAAGAEACVLLGHPDYYPRFGFRPAPPLGLTCKWPVPDEVFQVLELAPGALAARAPSGGSVRYAPEFDRF